MRGLNILVAATDVVQKHYALQLDFELQTLPGRRHVFLVTSHNSRYVLKCVAAPSVTIENIQSTHRLVQLLSHRHFATYSLISSILDSTWVIDYDLIWEMHTYVEGEPLQAIAVSPETVGQLLGTYHKTVSHLLHDRSLTVPVGIEEYWHSVDPVAVLKVLRSTATGQTAVAFLDSLVDQSLSWISSLAGPEIVVPVHGDVSASNVIVNSERAYLIDFECIRWEDPLVDLAQAVARLILPKRTDTEAQRMAVDRILSSYLTSSGFPRSERSRLAAAVSLHLVLDWACEQLRGQPIEWPTHGSHASLSRALDSLRYCLV